MSTRFIRIDQGLCTSKAAVLLDEGELTRADDCYYKPGDPGVWTAMGRTAVNSSPETGAIKGVRYLEFENAPDLLVDHVGTAYRSQVASTSGNFSDLITGLVGGSTLDSVHYNNQHFLLNGVDRNRVVLSDGTTLYHGMLANTAAPMLFRDAGSGSGFTLTPGYTLTYWIEERVKDSSGTIIKRNVSAVAQCVTLTGDGTLDKPLITVPAYVNPDITHWALIGTATNGAFPNGAEIAEVDISVLSISDTRTGSNPSLPAGNVYETLSIEVAGVTQNYAENGPPAIANTGDIFEDSLVTNVASDTSQIVYSVENAPHVFPAINVIKFETKEADEVKCIRRLGDGLLVLMRDSVWRVATLPRPEDSSFQTERVKSQVQGALGCVGPLAADTWPSQTAFQLAYVGRYGILTTDGYSWGTLTDDLDWEATVDISKLGSSVLLYDPRHFVLIFYYTPLGGSTNSRALFLHLHPTQMKAINKPKITGPINVAAVSACLANIDGFDEVLTGNANGTLYREWTGVSDASGAGGIQTNISTADVYTGGLGTMSSMRRFWLHHGAAPGVTATVSITRKSSGQPDGTTTASVDLTREEPSHVYKQVNDEGMRFGIAVNNPGTQVRFNLIATDILPQEDIEESRK
jgi:hypothetical protein